MIPIVLLCAGNAKRLRPITDTVPKCLIEVCGKPFLFWQIKLLEEKGFDKIVITGGYRQQQIENFLRDNKFDADITLLYNNFLPNTGGGTKRASALFKDDFFVMYGDSYLPYLDFQEVEKTYFKNKKLGLLTIYKNNNQMDSSNILYSEEQDQILEYKKKAFTKEFEYIDYGVSIFSQKAIDEYTKNIDYFDIDFLHKKLIRDNQLSHYICNKRFYEVGSFEGIEDFTNYIKDNNN